jgi:aerobic carbon-monoxide dehydrogenase medium subunit
MTKPLATEIMRPKSIEEALTILSEKKGCAAILAGGTDLVCQINEGYKKPSCIVDIIDLPLRSIKESSNGDIVIGATATASQIQKSELLAEKIPVIQKAAKHLGGPQTAELATIGGNICNASPCANSTNVLMALNARIKIEDINGKRELLLRDHIYNVLDDSKLNGEEILTEITIPALPRVHGTSYIKHVLRKEMDIAIVGVAIFIVPKGDEIEDVRIALGSVGPTVILAHAAQQVLKGKKFDQNVLTEAAQVAADQDASYIDDVRSSATYRKQMTSVLVRKAIVEAWVMAKAKGGGK